MKNIKRCFLLVVCFVVWSNLFAGWVIKQKSYDSDQGSDVSVSEIIYMQDNVMKVVQNNLTTIFNLNNEKIVLINTDNQKYWEGSVDSYQNDLKSAMKSAMEEQLKNVPEDQRKMMDQMYANMMENMDKPNQLADSEPQEYELEIIENGKDEEIAGYQTRKFEVKVNGYLKESVWLSRLSGMRKDFDIDLFFSAYEDFLIQGMGETMYQLEDEYMEMSKKGFPMKTVEYYSGYQFITEVVSMEEKSLDDSEFLPPDNYEKVDLSELGLTNE